VAHGPVEVKRNSVKDKFLSIKKGEVTRLLGLLRGGPHPLCIDAKFFRRGTTELLMSGRSSPLNEAGYYYFSGMIVPPDCPIESEDFYDVSIVAVTEPIAEPVEDPIVSDTVSGVYFGHTVLWHNGDTKVGRTTLDTSAARVVQYSKETHRVAVRSHSWRFFTKSDLVSWERGSKAVFQEFCLPGTTEYFSGVPYETLLAVCDLYARLHGGASVNVKGHVNDRVDSRPRRTRPAQAAA
jgi:hypothetical protein